MSLKHLFAGLDVAPIRAACEYADKKGSLCNLENKTVGVARYSIQDRTLDLLAQSDKAQNRLDVEAFAAYVLWAFLPSLTNPELVDDVKQEERFSQRTVQLVVQLSDLARTEPNSSEREFLLLTVDPAMQRLFLAYQTVNYNESLLLPVLRPETCTLEMRDPFTGRMLVMPLHEALEKEKGRSALLEQVMQQDPLIVNDFVKALRRMSECLVSEDAPKTERVPPRTLRSPSW